RDEQERELRGEARELERPDDDPREARDRDEVEHRAPGSLDRLEERVPRRTGLRLEGADDERRRDREHPGLARLPAVDHEGIEEHEQRDQEDPAAAHHPPDLRQLRPWESYDAVLRGLEVYLDEEGEVVEARRDQGGERDLAVRDRQ